MDAQHVVERGLRRLAPFERGEFGAAERRQHGTQPGRLNSG